MKKQLLIIVFFSIQGLIICQSDSSSIKMITLTDGSELKGNIISEDSIEVKFKTLSGSEFNIIKTQIKEIEETEGSWSGGQFLSADPNQTRLLFSPTARTLKQGDGYFSVYEIFFPFLAVGLTDFITLAGGVSLFPGADQQIVYIAPKIRMLHLNSFNLSSGVLYAHIADEDFGIMYGVFTFGSSRASLTGGLGWGFVNGEYADNPVIMIGGEVQLSNYFKIITETWIPPNSDVALISFGLRFFGRALAADFALITPTEGIEGFPFIPWIGFAYNF